MITLFDFIEDYDNIEAFDRYEKLLDAVDEYNDEYGTDYDPQREVIKYFRWVKEKYQPEM